MWLSETSISATASRDAEHLCLTCGLCCNGVIFADVALQPGDDPARLQQVGLDVFVAKGSGASRRNRRCTARSLNRDIRFSQPCAALDGCKCRIYPNRPTYCRQFECVLLKSVEQGKTEQLAALEIIRTARKRADRVRSLLRELGDTEEQLPLATRFRRTTDRLDAIGFDEPTAEIYGRLTLAVHDLNFILADAFYPGEAASEPGDKVTDCRA